MAPGADQHLPSSGIFDLASHRVIVSGIYIGVALLAKVHHVSYGQKLFIFGGVGHMTGEAIFDHWWMSLFSEKFIFIVTLKTESLGRRIQEGLGVGGVW